MAKKDSHNLEVTFFLSHHIVLILLSRKYPAPSPFLLVNCTRKSTAVCFFLLRRESDIRPNVGDVSEQNSAAGKRQQATFEAVGGTARSR